jgi:hypothetical protein
MRYTITYTRTLTLEETIEVPTRQEAERHAEKRAWEDGMLNGDFESGDTEFEVEEVVEQDEEESVPEREEENFDSWAIRQPMMQEDARREYESLFE